MGCGGFWFRASGLGFRASGLGFRASGLECFFGLRVWVRGVAAVES